jgi:hypothetical protein
MDMESNCKEHFFIFSHHWKRHLMSLTSTCYCLKIKSFYSQLFLLVLISIFKIFKLHPYQFLSQECHFQIQPMGANDDDIL